MTSTEIDYRKYLEHDPTPLMEHFEEWLRDKAELDPKTFRTKDEAFRYGVYLAVHLRGHHQASPENQDRLEANRKAAVAEAAELQRRKELRERVGAGSRGRLPKAALEAVEAMEKPTPKKRGRPAKAAAAPEPAAKTPAKKRATRAPAAKPAPKPKVTTSKRTRPARAAKPAVEEIPATETPRATRTRRKAPAKVPAPVEPTTTPEPAETETAPKARRRRKAPAAGVESAPSVSAPSNVTPIRRRRPPRPGEAAF